LILNVARKFGLICAIVLACALAGAIAVARASTEASSTQKVSAHFIYVEGAQAGGGCSWSIGIEFSPVAHAISYEVSYFDGYYQTVETASVTPKTLAQSDALLYENHELSQGELLYGVTGGAGSGACSHEGGDPTEGGRFSKGATVIATIGCETATAGAARTASCAKPPPKASKPKPPPIDNSSTAMKDSLNADSLELEAESARDLAKGGALVGIGTGATTMLGLAGTAGLVLTAPVSAPILGLSSAFLAVGSYLLYKSAMETAEAKMLAAQALKDPPRGGYGRVSKPVTPPVPAVVASKGDPSVAAVAKAANKVFANEAQLTGVLGVIVTAVDRSSGALAAHDHAAYELQKAAAVRYLDRAASLLVAGVKLRHRVAAAFEATKINLTVTPQGSKTISEYLASHGLPSATVSELRKLGDSEAQITALQAKIVEALAAPSSELELWSSLSSPKLDLQARRLAKDDRAEARYVSKLP
jgi:hypothetical protein